MQDDQVFVYALGIVACSACAPSDMPLAMVVAEVNMQEPTGISSDWTLDESPTFHGGEPNPSPCDKHPEVRTHYLFKC